MKIESVIKIQINVFAEKIRYCDQEAYQHKMINMYVNMICFFIYKAFIYLLICPEYQSV